MSNIDEESKRYKNISRQEIELLSGFEQEKAQMISGIYLSHKRTLKTVAESPQFAEYIALLVTDLRQRHINFLRRKN